MENDFVFQCRVDLSTALEPGPLELRIDVAQGLDTHLQSERDSQRALARSRSLQLHLLSILAYPDENLWE